MVNPDDIVPSNQANEKQIMLIFSIVIAVLTFSAACSVWQGKSFYRRG